MGKVIFFDIDGTLIDHAYAERSGVLSIYYKSKSILGDAREEEFYDVWIKASGKYIEEYLKGNLTFKEQRVKRLQDIFLHFNKPITEDDAYRIFTEYLVEYEASWKCFSDVIPCLEDLKKHQLGIISNGDKNQQIKKLRNGGILDYFSHIIVSSEIGYPKPNIEIFNFACREADVSPENAIYIGDDLETDIEPAKRFGLDAVLIDREDRYNTEYKKINSLKQLTLE